MVFNHTKGKKGVEPVTGPTVLPPKLKGLMIVDAGYLSSRKYRTRPLLPVGTGLKKYRRHTLSQDGLSCLRAVDSGLLCNPRNPFCPNPTTGFRLKPWQNMDQFSEGRFRRACDLAAGIPFLRVGERIPRHIAARAFLPCQ